MEDLKRIARRAMLDHGLLPEFSAEAVAQTSSITQPAGDSTGRDLGLCFCGLPSITTKKHGCFDPAVSVADAREPR